MNRSWCFIACFIALTHSTFAGAVLSTQADMERALKALQRDNRDVMSLGELAESPGGHTVWMVELGVGSSQARAEHPAMLIAAGVEGERLASTETALAFIEHVLDELDGNTALRETLESTTIYVVPRLNPDAAQSYFEQPLAERRVDATPHDADSDGYIDEDGADDINGDGMISWMRVYEAGATLMPHPDDDRLLIEADANEGEAGGWLLTREGRDNDGDEQINEDGAGGTNYNHNFPYAYPWFHDEAGVMQLSAEPTRALAEFMIERPHIGLVFAFSSHGNLLKVPDSGGASANRQPQTEMRSEDAELLAHLGKTYRETIGLGKEVETEAVPGAFADWVYFHQGRMALSAPLWNMDLALAYYDATVKDASEESDEESEGMKSTEEKRGASEFRYLQWAELHNHDLFTDWEAIDHPDYPGQRVEVGGWKPFATVVPPASRMDALLEAHAGYLLSLIDVLPRIGIESIEVGSPGGDVYELTIRVANSGYLPTILTHGERTRDMLPTRVEVDLPADTFLGGQARTMLPSISGSGGVAECRVVVRISARSVDIRVVSSLAGVVTQTVTLEGE